MPDGVQHDPIRGLIGGPDGPEHPCAPVRLQGHLSRLAGLYRLVQLQAALASAQYLAGLAVLRDLCGEGTDHQWLWLLSVPDDTALSVGKFVDAVRLRLGADPFEGTAHYAQWGAVLDLQCRHAPSCALGPST